VYRPAPLSIILLPALQPWWDFPFTDHTNYMGAHTSRGIFHQTLADVFIRAFQETSGLTFSDELELDTLIQVVSDRHLGKEPYVSLDLLFFVVSTSFIRVSSHGASQKPMFLASPL
jgi:hypothetical protein